MLALAEQMDMHYADVNQLGNVTLDDSYLQKHIDKILALPLVNVEAIKKAQFKVAIDCVNSTEAYLYLHY